MRPSHHECWKCNGYGEPRDEQHRRFGCELARAFEHNQQPPPLPSLDDVAEVLKSWTDDSDEPSFAWLLRLKDGRFAVATGSHDYTGWDCQSSLRVTVHDTREEAIAFGMTLNDRENLGLLLPGEAIA